MRFPRWLPGNGVQVIDTQIPPGVVPPSTSLTAGLQVEPQDKPPPPPPPPGKKCTCCGGRR